MEPENQQPEPRRSSPEVEHHQLPADPNEPVRIASSSTDAAQSAAPERASVPAPQPSPGEVPPASRAENKTGDESQRLEEWEDRLTTLEADLTARQIELAAHQEEVEAERKRLAEWNNEIAEREAFLRAGRKQFQATLDAFHAEQRRFRMAVVSVKAQRIRARRRKEENVLAAQDQLFVQNPQFTRLPERVAGELVRAEPVPRVRDRELPSPGFACARDLRMDLRSPGRNGRLCASRSKTVRRDHAADAAAAQCLEREARIGGAVDHNNVVRTRSFGRSEDGTAYLAMDLVEGVTLGELITLHGKLPWARCVTISSRRRSGSSDCINRESCIATFIHGTC